MVNWAGNKNASFAALDPLHNQFTHITGSIASLLQKNTNTSAGAGNSSSAVADANVVDAGCSTGQPMRAGLANVSDAQLRRLAQYEAVCGSAIFSRASFFIATPATKAAATQDAAIVAAKLKVYAQYNIPPLVFMEPTDDDGNNLNFTSYSTGAYDDALHTFYAALKSNGVSDAMMGTWVYFPESNMPTWGTISPSLFAINVTKTAQIQKQYFPASQSSIMLDSESYQPGSSWGQGSYVSLQPYVQNIPKGLIDSFGLQGFPWAAPAGQPDSLYNPQTFLQVSLAAQAAQTLGTKNIWLNTGTFSRAYTQNASQLVNIPAAQRQTILNGVVAQAKALQAQGFTVSVHLFAQNKSNVAEAIDWSYWGNQPDSGPNEAVFKAFAHEITTAGVQLWLFDSND